MAKGKSVFVCQNCGVSAQRWQGRCEDCGEWNSFVEEGTASGIGAQAAGLAAKGRPFALEGLSGSQAEAPRIKSGMGELDRVTGGGFVPGSVILIGGEPGIGKSTLLIQACAALARQGQRVVYISGEEAVAQVRLRAERLGLSQSNVELAAETSVEDILATLQQGKRPALLIIDSIQTMWTARAEAAPETYVLTPYVEVVPGAAPLGAADAAALAAELRGPIDARQIQRGYAWMGSTLSLTDLIDGINALDAAGLPLRPDQRAQLGARLAQVRADHAAMIAVQQEILDLERALEADIAAVQAVSGGAGATGAGTDPVGGGLPPPATPPGGGPPAQGAPR